MSSTLTSKPPVRTPTESCLEHLRPSTLHHAFPGGERNVNTRCFKCDCKRTISAAQRSARAPLTPISNVPPTRTGALAARTRHPADSYRARGRPCQLQAGCRQASCAATLQPGLHRDTWARAATCLPRPRHSGLSAQNLRQTVLNLKEKLKTKYVRRTTKFTCH